MKIFVPKFLAYGTFPQIIACMGFSSSSYIWYFGQENFISKHLE